MEKFIKENWFKVGLLIILVVSIAGAFYWFEWRPASIRNRCMEQSVPVNIGDSRDWAPDRDIFEVGDALYQNCIRLYGIFE